MDDNISKRLRTPEEIAKYEKKKKIKKFIKKGIITAGIVGTSAITGKKIYDHIKSNNNTDNNTIHNNSNNKQNDIVNKVKSALSGVKKEEKNPEFTQKDLDLMELIGELNQIYTNTDEYLKQ